VQKDDYTGRLASRLTWTLWSFAWTPNRPGDHRLVVRATDGTGALQIAKDRTSGPEGATGLHRVMARIA